MKTVSLIFLAILSAVSFCVPAASSAEMKSEEYVYALELKGKVTYQTEATGKVSQQLRDMELIPLGAILEIGEGARVSLTCPGCKVLNLTYKGSPYKVKMEDFKRDSSTVSEKFGYFISALKNFVYPDSKIGPKAILEVRSEEVTGESSPCKNLWPRDEAQIMPVGDHITFSWPSRGTNLLIEIRGLESNKIVYSQRTSSDQINVPMKIFKPGMGYEWSLFEEKMAKSCYRTFELLKEEDSIAVMKIIDDIASFLPPEADNETRYRLQAGYLYSKELAYDAWQWLESNGISQE